MSQTIIETSGRAAACATPRVCAGWHPRRARGAGSTSIIVMVLVLAAIVAAAWWFFGASRSAPGTPAPGSPTAATPAAPQSQVTSVPDDLTVGELYKAARAAMGESRMVTPPGNNALEFYLRILAKQPDDANATDALRELFPFATGSAEDQINQGNFDEASRIMTMLAKADPSNYTLTILRSKLDAKKKQGDRDLQLQAQQAAAAAARAANPGAQGAAPAAPAATAVDPLTGAVPTTPAPTATPPVATPRPAEVARATPPPVVAPPPAPAVPAPRESRDARVLTPPQPNYPATAARSRQEGWVEVEFTVAVDGSVQNARVVNAQPSRVFDREAVRAIEQARFEPRVSNGEPVAATLRRRIEFKLGN